MSDYISKEETINTIWKTFDSFADNPSNFELEETYAIRRFCFKLQEEMKAQPTLDEKEIIRKYGEQIIKKLEFESEWSEPTFDEDGYCNDDSWEMVWLDKAIEIIKEECGINE